MQIHRQFGAWGNCICDFSISWRPDVLLSFQTFNRCHMNPPPLVEKSHFLSAGRTMKSFNQQVQNSTCRCMNVQHYPSFSFKRERKEKKEDEMIWNCPGEPMRTGLISFIPYNNRGSLFHLRATQRSRTGVSHCMTSRNQSKPGVIRMTDAIVVCNRQGALFFFFIYLFIYSVFGVFLVPAFRSVLRVQPRWIKTLSDKYVSITFHTPEHLCARRFCGFDSSAVGMRPDMFLVLLGELPARERGRESERWPKLMWQTGLPPSSPSSLSPSLPPSLPPLLPPLLKDNKEGQRIEDVKGRMSERQEVAWILTSPSKMFSDRGVE